MADNGLTFFSPRIVAVRIVYADKYKPRFSTLFSSFTENSMTHPADQKDASGLQNNLSIYLPFESELIQVGIQITQSRMKTTSMQPFFKNKCSLLFWLNLRGREYFEN